MQITRLYTYYDTHIWTRILYICILSLYPAFSIAVMNDSSIYNFFDENARFVLKLCPTNVYEKIILSCWVPLWSIITHILGYIAKKDYYYLTRDGFVTIMDSMDEIVAKKSERIGKAIKCKETDFTHTFAPELQIKIIIDQLYNDLKLIFKIRNDISIRCWYVKNGNIKQLMYSIPSKDEVSADSKLLDSVNSELKKAVQLKRSVIVNDSKKDNSFNKLNKCSECEGCNLLTIPIYDDIMKTDVAVLQIRVRFNKEQKITFISKNKKQYLEIMDRYIKRIKFELRMKILINN